jgi:hypothetical protein
MQARLLWFSSVSLGRRQHHSFSSSLSTETLVKSCILILAARQSAWDTVFVVDLGPRLQLLGRTLNMHLSILLNRISSSCFLSERSWVQVSTSGPAVMVLHAHTRRIQNYVLRKDYGFFRGLSRQRTIPTERPRLSAK